MLGLYINAAVSPTIRPIANITPDNIPGTADGSTILNIVRSLPAPNPKLPYEARFDVRKLTIHNALHACDITVAKAAPLSLSRT